MMTLDTIFLILITGLAAGFINVSAGGGSLLTLPVLITLGLPSAEANGTNRIAIIIQNMTAVWNYSRNGYNIAKLGIWLSLPAIVGTIIGARIAITIPEPLFNKILAGVLIVALLFLVWKPKTNIEPITQPYSWTRKLIAIIVFFFIGLYGGFIQAGIGFVLMIAIVSLFGLSLVQTNGVKLLVVLIYVSVSLIIFAFNGQVNWLLGLLLAAGNATGAWIGTTFAMKKGDRVVRVITFVAILLMAGKLLGLYEWLFS